MCKYQRYIAAGLLLLSAHHGALAKGPVASSNAMRAHVAFLASDALEGRETGSRGYAVAASYVATRMQQAGVLPNGDEGGYLQAVPLRATRLVATSPVLEISGPAGKTALAYLDDFSVSGSLLEERSDVAAPLVFAGYGIETVRFGQDDYAGLDVKGKIVVVLAGKPSSLPTEEGAHFSSGEFKRAAAARHGAVGMVTLQTPTTEKASPFAKARQYRFIPSMGWLDASGKPPHELAAMQNRAHLSMKASEQLFAGTGVTLADIYTAAEANRPLPRMVLKTSARMAKQSVRSDLTGHNVVGLIEGSDPKLKDEYVVFSAHLDHLGIVPEKTGDNIFNGAMDNATGVATLLEMARLFGESPQRPKRSILFVALTAEEKGLLGSEYFASNAPVRGGVMVANVNLDMPLLTYDFKNMMAFGAEHSSLKGTVERVLRRKNMALIADPWPQLGLFTRSDHYMFVRQGVPSIFLATGMASFKTGEQPARLWDEFLGTRYHQPNDDMTQALNFDAAARFAQVNYDIAMEIANAPTRPTWNKGDFFGDTFGK